MRPLSPPRRPRKRVADSRSLLFLLCTTASTHGPLPQSRFLTSLGLQPRLAGLLRGAATDERRKEIESAAKRLVDQGGMGSQYKVMAVTPKGAKDVFPFDLVE